MQFISLNSIIYYLDTE